MEIRSGDNTTGASSPSGATEALVTVRVVLMGELKQWAGRREVEIRLARGSTIQDLARRLPALCGANFERRVLTKEGAFQPHVAVFLNGMHIGEMQGTQTVLSEGHMELMVLPSSEGG